MLICRVQRTIENCNCIPSDSPDLNITEKAVDICYTKRGDGLAICLSDLFVTVLYYMTLGTFFFNFQTVYSAEKKDLYRCYVNLP